MTPTILHALKTYCGTVCNNKDGTCTDCKGCDVSYFINGFEELGYYVEDAQ